MPRRSNYSADNGGGCLGIFIVIAAIALVPVIFFLVKVAAIGVLVLAAVGALLGIG